MRPVRVGCVILALAFTVFVGCAEQKPTPGIWVFTTGPDQQPHQGFMTARMEFTTTAPTTNATTRPYDVPFQIVYSTPATMPAVAMTNQIMPTSPPRLELPIGTHCEVRFRRDIAPNGVVLVQSATKDDKGAWHFTQSPANSVSGKITKSDDTWIVITDGSIEHWIPRTTILVIEIIKGYSPE